MKKDRYEASFSNLGIKDAEISAGIVKEYEKLLVGGIWVIATLSYYHEEGQSGSPFGVTLLKPIQMPNMNMQELFEGRAALSTVNWRETLIRSIGMEPSTLDESVQWHLLARMIPFVENNYNVCELGPAAPERVTSTRNAHQTACLCLVAKPPSLTCSTT